MTQPQDQYRELIQQSQEAFKDAVDTWTKTVQETVSSVGVPANSAQVDLQPVADQVFEFAERMLAMQRDFSRNLIQSSVAMHEGVTPGGRDSSQATEA